MSSNGQNGGLPNPSAPAPDDAYVDNVAAYMQSTAPVTYWHPVALQRTAISFNPSDPGHAAARVVQPPANYSSSQEGTSVANSHTPYAIRVQEERARQERERNRAYLSTSATDQDDTQATRTMTTTEEGSFYSYHSSRDLSTFLREADGRMFNNQSDLYMLPSDDDEFQRLAKQHYSIALCMGGLTPCPELVNDILDPAKHPDPTVPPGILDLGCGSGIWAMEMAQQYPHASVVGVDLAPVAFDQSTMPTNIRFEIDDITLGLSHYYNRFNVVQVRCITGGIPNYRIMMAEVEACLRPGGVVIFIDGDTLMHSEDCLTPVPAAMDDDEPEGPVEGSWLQRLARETRFASIHQGCDVAGSEHNMMTGLWNHPLIDPASIRVGGLFTPIGPWATSPDLHYQQKLRYAGSLMRQDVIRMIRAWHPLLKTHGIPEDVINRWTQRTDEELDKMTYHMSLHWMITWGRRRMNAQQQAAASAIPAPAPNQPISTPTPTLAAPSTSAVPSTSATPSASAVPSTSAIPSTSATPSASAVPSTSAAPTTSTAASTSAAPSNEATAATPAAPAVAGFQALQIRASREEVNQVAQIHLEGLCSLPTPMVNRLRTAVDFEVYTDDINDLSYILT